MTKLRLITRAVPGRPHATEWVSTTPSARRAFGMDRAPSIRPRAWIEVAWLVAATLALWAFLWALGIMPPERGPL